MNATGIVYLLIIIGLFFALRGLALWYWRVYTLIDQQARLIVLAEEQLVESRATNAILARMSGGQNGDLSKPRTLAKPAAIT